MKHLLILYVLLVAVACTSAPPRKTRAVAASVRKAAREGRYVFLPIRPLAYLPEEETKQEGQAFAALEPPFKTPTVFRWGNGADTVLLCKEGTKLVVPANAFVRQESGKPAAGEITLKVREFYRLADQLKHRLATRSDASGLLETGGMLQITASENGKPLELAAGKELEIGFPTAERKDGMQLFYGNWDDRGVNWTLRTADPLFSTKIGVHFELPASFPGGYPALRRYLSENLVYPPEAVRQGIAGKVWLQFVVTEDGKIEKPIVKRSASPLLDEAAREIVSKMPDWIPASSNGKPVNSWFTLPVSFSLDGEKDAASSELAASNAQTVLETTEMRERLSGNQLMYYMLTSARLGWINCDRILDIPGKRVDCIVTTGQFAGAETVSLVLDKYAAAIAGVRLSDGSWEVRGIPENEPVTVVVVAEKDDGNYLALQRLNARGGRVAVAGFRRSDEYAIDRALNQLGRK